MSNIEDDRRAINQAGAAAEFPPGSMASGSVTEWAKIRRARVAKCMELGGWVRGDDGCVRCDGTRQEHTPEER